MSTTAVATVENRRSGVPRKVTLTALRRALESRGVEFGPDGWVRMGDDRGLVLDDVASMSRRTCERALESIEKARRILRGMCGGMGNESS